MVVSAQTAAGRGRWGALQLPPGFVCTSFISAERPFQLAAMRAGQTRPSASELPAVILGTTGF